MEEQITPLKTGIKYGLYLGVFGMIWQLILHYGGLENFSQDLGMLDWVLLFTSIFAGFIITFLGIKYFRENNEGLLTFGEGMSVALFVGVFSGLLIAVFMYIYAAYIVPDLGEVIMDSFDTDEIPADQAEAMEGVMSVMSSPIVMSFTALIQSIFMGVIYGLIGSLILKKGQ